MLSPVSSSGWSLVGGSVTLLSETSVSLTRRSQTSELSSVLLLGNNPVNSWVLLDSGMGWINKDDLEELVGGILSYPVGVKDSHVGASSSDLLFSDISVRSGLLQLGDTLMNGLSVNCTLMDCSLSSSSSDSNSVDGVSLLLLESHGSSLIQS